MADLGVLKSTPGGHDFLYDFSTTLHQMMGDLDFSTCRGSDESDWDENTFCTPDTVDQCISFLNQELLSLGFQALSYDNQSKMSCLINRLYQLLRLIQRHGRSKEELENRLHRLNSECEHYQHTIARLKTEREKLLRDVYVEQEKSRQLLVKHKASTGKLKSEKEEVKRLLSVNKDKDIQFKHDLRKKERECNKLKERIHQLLADKTPSRRVGLDIAYSLQSSDGKRSTWKTTSNKQDEMYQHLMTMYEEKQKELLVENAELRTSLKHVHKDISKALGLHDHVISASTKSTMPQESEPCSSEEEFSTYPSVSTCRSHDSDGYFQMPYDMIRENLENMFKERSKKLKERRKRKLPSPTKPAKSSPPKPNKPGDMEQFKKEIEILKKQIKTYEDQIEKHRREKENYKEVIQQQEDMIQNAIQTQKHQQSGELFLDDSKLVQEKESLSEHQKLFREEKINFIEERKQLTEATIKLGKEKRALDEEKTAILKTQFLQISPFRSPRDKSTPHKVDSVRLLPSTPQFSPAPSGQPKTPSTVELLRFLGITPKEQFLQHKNSSSEENSELKRSLSSEYLNNNNTTTDFTNHDFSAFSDNESSLARRSLFQRRSSTGSNEDLGV
ncbi:afadin- and alpha-actinin-binding protein-like [Ostrea edulis]|uniref:afadin- and alpha-actinin-binding protein-like n=1 Tax=Ostrea edulis TaxID=37623 RepID=UPI0024AEA5E9|nr:afadin- and alpha-actinin-binding protein-like [Ostrea edulis]